MNKQQLVASIINRLSTEMELIANAAKAAHDEATHDEEFHKNQFETPGLETSVLAEGQVKVATELHEALEAFRSLTVREFAPQDPVEPGALVETESAGEKALYFVGPKGGGIETDYEGTPVFVITPHSPLGAKMLGHHVGDSITTAAGRPPVKILGVR